jgi:hypothetical protein
MHADGRCSTRYGTTVGLGYFSVRDEGGL